jgi:cytochrome c biogenesis protein CcmG/thiol:disulfide interchange protein DsbE
MRIDLTLKALGGVLLAALAYVVGGAMRDPVVQVGDKAPAFTLVTNGGETVTERNFGGKLLVLNFWATWCPPCVEEMPSLNEFHRQLRDAGVVVLAVSVDRNEQAYRRFVERFGLEFPTALDTAAEVPASYGTFKYPETYIINARGEVLEKFIGEENWADPRLIDRIKKLL